ncbi:MAG: TOMM precursor leader peptide-binding protein [Nocardioides sp.]
MVGVPPREPMLRPGLLVTRRDDRTLQVGLEPRRRVGLPDAPEMRAALKALATGALADDPDLAASEAAAEAVRRLVAADLLVDRRALVAALAHPDPTDPLAQSGVAAAFAQHGASAPDRLATRAAASVSVRLLGSDRLLDVWAREVTGLLRRSGMRSVVLGDDTATTVALVLSAGEPDRDLLDGALATGQPHLLLTVVEGVVRLGPFVDPGLTACVRCVDAHLDERDDRRAVVVRQHADAGPDPTGLPRPADPALVAMALAWAARDLVSFVDGDPPSTRSATVSLEPDLTLARHHWRRHPHCGCCWGDLLDVV